MAETLNYYIASGIEIPMLHKPIETPIRSGGSTQLYLGDNPLGPIISTFRFYIYTESAGTGTLRAYDNIRDVAWTETYSASTVGSTELVDGNNVVFASGTGRFTFFDYGTGTQTVITYSDIEAAVNAVCSYPSNPHSYSSPVGATGGGSNVGDGFLVLMTVSYSSGSPYPRVNGTEICLVHVTAAGATAAVVSTEVTTQSSSGAPILDAVSVPHCSGLSLYCTRNRAFLHGAAWADTAGGTTRDRIRVYEVDGTFVNEPSYAPGSFSAFLPYGDGTATFLQNPSGLIITHDRFVDADGDAQVLPFTLPANFWVAMIDNAAKIYHLKSTLSNASRFVDPTGTVYYNINTSHNQMRPWSTKLWFSEDTSYTLIRLRFIDMVHASHFLTVNFSGGSGFIIMRLAKNAQP